MSSDNKIHHGIWTSELKKKTRRIENESD